MRTLIAKETLGLIKFALERNLELEYSHIDGEGTDGQRRVMYWDRTLHIETANAQYLIGYNDSLTELYVEHSELKPSYGGGYEWVEEERHVYTNPAHITDYVHEQERWYNSY